MQLPPAAKECMAVWAVHMLDPQWVDLHEQNVMPLICHTQYFELALELTNLPVAVELRCIQLLSRQHLKCASCSPCSASRLKGDCKAWAAFSGCLWRFSTELLVSCRVDAPSSMLSIVVKRAALQQQQTPGVGILTWAMSMCMHANAISHRACLSLTLDSICRRRRGRLKLLLRSRTARRPKPPLPRPPLYLSLCPGRLLRRLCPRRLSLGSLSLLRESRRGSPGTRTSRIQFFGAAASIVGIASTCT